MSHQTSSRPSGVSAKNGRSAKRIKGGDREQEARRTLAGDEEQWCDEVRSGAGRASEILTVDECPEVWSMECRALLAAQETPPKNPPRASGCFHVGVTKCGHWQSESIG